MKAVSFVNLRKCFPTLTEPTVMILSVGVLLEGKNLCSPTGSALNWRQKMAKNQGFTT